MKKYSLFLLLFFSLINFAKASDPSENSYDKAFDRDPFYELEDNGISQTFSTEGVKCGSGLTSFIVPDMPLGFDFTPSCTNHDKCYETCGLPKSYCDSKFRDNMKNWCKNRFSSLDPRRPICRTAAQSYWQAVKDHGERAYRRAQSENCPRRH
ncbi:MAG: phospholipase A2 [Bacteriovoracales bacterium]